MSKPGAPVPSIERVRAALAAGRGGCRRKDGRHVIRVDGWLGLRSRMVWAAAHGAWPDAEIDHINCDPSDDRLENLRLATSSQNKGNQRRKITNTSGRKGVSWNASLSRWQAHIQLAGVNRYLGLFDDVDTAAAAYLKAAEAGWGEFARAA